MTCQQPMYLNEVVNKRDPKTKLRAYIYSIDTNSDIRMDVNVKQLIPVSFKQVEFNRNKLNIVLKNVDTYTLN